MNDHELGSRLRRQILTDLERGISCDGRRLQALVGDYCGDSQLTLLPALRYLVMSPGFSSAVAQQPPLPADGRLQLRLRQELEQVFTGTICQRMAGVVGGLLGLPEAGTGPGAAAEREQPAAVPPPAPAPTLMAEEATAPVPAEESSGGASGCGVVALLGAMAGMVMVGVVGGLTWLVLLNRTPLTFTPAPSAAPTPTVPTPAPATPPTTVSPNQPPPAPDLSQPLSADQAIASVQQLYANLSSGNMDAARQLFGPAAADQFDPAFFSQFREVRVSDLRETGRSGSSLILEGVVTFVYPDGSSQVESRSYTVETTSEPPLITASSFGAVIKARN